ncbi:MAG: DUF427 domain-containing protein [Acaryochloridaceae cyanobacterium SU_2_1]|nr:DUF427 domain-containing protein [Acaryochloridaceae cyanobacterium SU_2_1]
MPLHRIEPGPGQESVWDYPRPPRLEDSQRHLQILFNGVIIADTHQAKRVLETSHPPVYYIPPTDVELQYLQLMARSTFCEWKGIASYYSLTVGERTEEGVAWFYAHPSAEFASLQDYIAFYPSRMDSCSLDGERVQAQPGDFYGGWITPEIVGPFKGGLGTWGW